MFFDDDNENLELGHDFVYPSEIGLVLSTINNATNRTIRNETCPGPLVPLPPGRHSTHRIPTCAFKRCTEKCLLLLYDEADIVEQKVIVGLLASVTFVCCVVALLTLVVNKQSDRFRPTSCLWALYSCYIVACLAYFIQFLSADFKHRISCLSSNAERIEEPDSADGTLCMLTFLLLYPASLAAEIWFVHLTQTWSSNFKRIAKAQHRPLGWIQRKVLLHSTAWLPPIVCTVLACTFHVISGDTVVGVCFIDNNQLLFRLAMWVAPTAALAVVAVCFAFKGVYYLRKFYMENSNSYSVRDMKRVQRTSVHLGVTTAVAALIVFIRATFQVLLLVQETYRVDHLESYVQCIEKHRDFGTTQTDPEKLSKRILFDCGHEPPENRHNRESFELIIYACWFAEGVAFSAFVFTPTYLRSWRLVTRPITRRVLSPNSWWNRDDNNLSGKAAESPTVFTVDNHEISTDSRGTAKHSVTSISPNSFYSSIGGLPDTEDFSYEADDELTAMHVDDKKISLSSNGPPSKSSYRRHISMPLGTNKSATLDPRGLLALSLQSSTSSAATVSVDNNTVGDDSRLRNWQERLRQQKRSTGHAPTIVGSQILSTSGGPVMSADSGHRTSIARPLTAAATKPRFRGDDVDEYQFHSAPYYLVRRKSQASPPQNVFPEKS